MNTTRNLLAALLLISALALTGCAGGKVISMGKDTYVVQRGGWPKMNAYALQVKCVEDANKFCRKRGLAMVPVNSQNINGQIFANTASAKFTFMAVPTNSPLNTVPANDMPQLIK